MCFWGVRKMSAAYKICGMAVGIYSWQKYLAWMPLVVSMICLNLDSQSWPLVRAAAPWAFQVSLLLTMTPRNLAVSFDGICWLPSMCACRGVGTFFLRRNG